MLDSVHEQEYLIYTVAEGHNTKKREVIGGYMFGMLLAGITLEKFIGIAVLVSALIVAWTTLAHSIPLALMIGLGQLHGHIQHHSHGAGEEGSHLAVHKF